MDYTDKQLDALRTLSRFIIVIIAGIAGVSLYLIQRGVASLLGLLDPLAYKLQIGYAGLNLVYATMTFVWPIALGAACLLLRVLVSKRDSIMRILVVDSPQCAVIASDPLCFERDAETKALSILIWLLRLLPPGAIVVGLLSFGYYTFVRVSTVDVYRAERGGVVAWTTTIVLLQIAGTVFGLRCMPALWSSLGALWLQTEPPGVGNVPSPFTETIITDQV